MNTNKIVFVFRLENTFPFVFLDVIFPFFALLKLSQVIPFCNFLGYILFRFCYIIK